MKTATHSNTRTFPDWAFWPRSLGLLRVANRQPKGIRVPITWHAAFDQLIPLGYEDKSGFHYGEPPLSETENVRR
jgi:hypothetical protein